MNVQLKMVRCIPNETVQLKRQMKLQPNRWEFEDEDWLNLASGLRPIQSILRKCSLLVLHRYTTTSAISMTVSNNFGRTLMHSAGVMQSQALMQA